MERDVAESLFSKSEIFISKYSYSDLQQPMTLLGKKKRQLVSVVGNTLAKYYVGALKFQTMMSNKAAMPDYLSKSIPAAIICLEWFEDVTRTWNCSYKYYIFFCLVKCKNFFIFFTS